MNIDFGAKFKKCRKDKGLSIAMLAEKAGVSPGMISQIERNTTCLLYTSPSPRDCS